ncbi:MAG TPA: hypothetical protein VHV52_09910 [Gaiellaceae bacterium]|jgi:hypothetical protein|nr:hypothetical protein [Gaiellaceae bacterium]
METELDPPQPEPVAEAVAEALAAPPPAPDPWWQAGIEEALGS